MRFSYLSRLVLLLFFAGCAGLLSCKNKTKLFSKLTPDNCGVTFENKVAVNDTTFNILDYLYYYNGGGVALGDINNDGLTDIYLTANRGANKLYLNKGNLHFEDITARAGVGGNADWTTGVTMADVNGDGLLDIYVSVVGSFKALKGQNQLFINNGNLTFSDSAKAYGLAVSAFSTQANFFDFDKDGDLDMFLVCHSIHSVESFKKASDRKFISAESGDKLFRNDNVNGRMVFTEVTRAAGILNSATGYGLNIMVGDFNNDAWADIYVSNDFHENDYYYLNNKNGTFTETNSSAFPHESRFSMGSDVADLNNDGWLDIVTLDMLPSDEKVLKSSTGDDAYDIYRYKKTFGYTDQYSRNCLQLNVGQGQYFSDVGLFSGMAATDWSWSPLAADFDNDGIKDLFITNGIAKRPNDQDYVKFVSSPAMLQQLQNGKKGDLEAIGKMPNGKVPNVMFRGTDNLKFQNTSNQWGFGEPTLSNGSAYADLDNDGDLDLVVNNLNSAANIYRNNSNTSQQHFIDFDLRGNGLNTSAVGATVALHTAQGQQLNYVTHTRGFLSASGTVIHFGVGDMDTIARVSITWPSGKVQQWKNLKTNRRYRVQEDSTSTQIFSQPVAPSAQPYIDIAGNRGLNWKHQENDFVDFNVQALMPRMASTQGPALAVADVNHDGLDDVFVTGARDEASALFVQQRDGRFKSVQQNLFTADSRSEDVAALFFDANGDGNADLYVCSAGNEFWNSDSALQDRLYMNDGKGNFTKSILPVMFTNTATVVAADIDKDGDLDLFIGGRVVTGKYGITPTSYLLINNGRGNFTIAPGNRAPGLSMAGMVTAASFTDINRDGWPDLVVVGEWMPVTIFLNRAGVFRKDNLNLQSTNGGWLSIKSVDVDDNGYPDLLLGNWGENSKFTASSKYPLVLYVGDLDGNGDMDQLLAVEKNGQYYPFNTKEELEKQFAGLIRKNNELFSKMAGQTIDEVFGSQINKMKKLQINTLSSCVLMNPGKSAVLQPLPGPMQYFPVFAWVSAANRQAKNKTYLAAGNFYGVTPFEGRYDAGNGQLLFWQNNKMMAKPVNGLRLNGEVRSMVYLRSVRNQQLLLIGRNNQPLALYNMGNAN